MGKEASFFSLLYSPSLWASPFSLLLPNHINSLRPSLLNIHSRYFSHAYAIFISFASITLPFFPTTVFQSRFPPPPFHFPHPYPFSCYLFLSPLSFSPSQMSDHSLLFRLPCHHIFHTTPSLNWACIIISYHVEYLITARDERWPPPIPSQTDRHTHILQIHTNTNTHVSVVVWDRNPSWWLCTFFTPHVCTKLSMWLLQCDRWDGVYSRSVHWCLYQPLVAFVMRQRMPWSQPCHIYR